MIVSRRVLFAASALALVLGSSAANAQQILTALRTEENDDVDVTRYSSTAGEQISHTFQGYNNRALTSYGTNKIYARAAGEIEQSTTSAWLDTYTAGGAAGSKVKLSFTFTIDGRSQFGPYDDQDWNPNYNFKVYALRGTGWQMHGQANSSMVNAYSARISGDDYDSLFLQRVVSGTRVQQLAMLDENGAIYNYADAAGQPGAFQGQVIYDEAGDVYKSTTLNQFGNPATGYFYKTFYRAGTPDGPVGNPIFYTAGTPQANALRSSRQNFEGNYATLDFAMLCSNAAGDCTARTWEPTPLTLSFELNAGEQFTLAAWLYNDGLYDGEIDFFNTAKVTGITAVDSQTGAAVALTSGSGTLISLPDGGFGYPAPTANVPEPATWAMMILGFGVVGGATRRRTNRNVISA